MKKYILLVVMFFTVTVFAADKGHMDRMDQRCPLWRKGNNAGHADCAKSASRKVTLLYLL
jgi:hypothetical protein